MKTVYQTDDQGYFVAAVPADPSPLEPDVWLIPRGAVEIAPPDASPGQIARMISGAWVLEDLPPPPGPPPAPEVGANQEAVWDGDKWTIQDLPEPEPEPEPEPTPEELLAAERARMRCSPLQGRLALAAAGLLPQVEAAVAAGDQTTQVAWEYAVEWKRTSPMIATLAVAVTMTETQMDDLFRAAMQIEV